MFGYNNDWDQPLELVEQTASSIEDYSEKLKDTILKKQDDHSQVRERLADAKRKSINKSRQEIQIKEGDIVVYRNHNVNDICNGLKSPYFGPFLVEKVFPNGRHCQIRNVSTDKILIAHKIHLRLYNPESINVPLPSENKAIKILENNDTKCTTDSFPANSTRSKDPAIDSVSLPSKACKEGSTNDVDSVSLGCKDAPGTATNEFQKPKRRKRRRINYDPHPTKTRQKKLAAKQPFDKDQSNSLTLFQSLDTNLLHPQFPVHLEEGYEMDNAKHELVFGHIVEHF